MLEKMNAVPPPSSAEPARAPSQDPARRDFSDWVKPGSDLAGQVPDNAVATVMEMPSHPLEEESAVIASPVHSTWMHGILYGWQLASQPGMSQLGGIHSRSGSTAVLQSNVRNGLSTAGTSGIPGQIGAPIDPVKQADPIRITNLGQGISSASSTNTTQSGSIEGGERPSLAALMAWSERSLRRVTSPEGQTTVWLRDYRIGDDEIPVLVDHLLGQHEGGASLHRIMINGVEVWRQEISFSMEQR